MTVASLCPRRVAGATIVMGCAVASYFSYLMSASSTTTTTSLTTMETRPAMGGGPRSAGGRSLIWQITTMANDNGQMRQAAPASVPAPAYLSTNVILAAGVAPALGTQSHATPDATCLSHDCPHRIAHNGI